MRIIDISLVLILAASNGQAQAQSQPPRPTPTKTAHANQNKAKPEQDKGGTNDEATKQFTSAINQLTAAVTAGNQQQSGTPHNDKTSAEGWAKASTILVTIFTGALAVLAFLQWRAMRHQIEIAQNTAESALLSAQAVINSDRPWVVVFMVRDPRSLKFKASNEGRSPATIIASYAQYAFIDNPANLPVPPHYGLELPRTVPMLVPNLSHDLAGPFIDLFNYAFAEVMEADPQRKHQIDTGLVRLVFWFRVVYTTQLAIDARLPPYETRFCCTYHPTVQSDLTPTGPDEYTRYA